MPVLPGGERRRRRRVREVRAEESRRADTGGCGSFGGCPGGAIPRPEQAQRVLRAGAGDRRATARLPGGHCLSLPVERAGTSHTLLSPSQAPPPRCPCGRAEGGQPRRPAHPSPRQLMSRGGRGWGRCCGAALESFRYLSPLRLAALLPGRGGGVRPEAALAGERRDGRRRLQGYVGLGEGRSRRTWFLGWRGA